MRSAPAAIADSKIRREPSTLISWLRAPAPMIANARCTTTSAPFTASRQLVSSWTSPWRYSTFFQPWLAGSNGRRAMPTMRLTRRERSSAETSAMPRSPVGPVTATVSPSFATGRLYPSAAAPGSAVAAVLRLRCLSDALAAVRAVAPVDRDGVLPGTAEHHVAAAVHHVDLVVAAAGVDPVAGRSAGGPVGAAAGADAVVPGAAVHDEAPGAGGDDLVVAGVAVQRRGLTGLGVRGHEVPTVSAIGEVGAHARVEAVVSGA